MRIMALDLGTKRVGVALSDELGLTAQGLTVIERGSHQEFLAEIGRLAEKHGATTVVLGLPRRMDGSLGPEAQRALAMAREIKKHLGLETTTWDERLTTAAVERVLLEADVSRSKRRKVRDKLAAAYILQCYLDHLSAGRSRAE
ncbi:MAG: Holliday junction resolvase RuvX [Thermodesulfobacteriota bacterium]